MDREGEAAASPPTVPTQLDAFGEPTEHVQAESAEARDHWDRRIWHQHPRRFWR
jgi:hypothetical protein